MNELVSIITPMYNAEKYIANTIESVINQDYSNWEHLIIDDGSSDMSVEIVKKYARSDSRIKLIKLEKNSGVAVARNCGLKNAIGDYIAYLDSDDMWKMDKLSRQLQFMKEENVLFSYTGYDICDANGIFLKTIIPLKNKLDYKELLKANYMACCTIMLKKEIALEMPYIGHEDYATWLDILKKNEIEAFGLSQPLSIYRKVGGSISSNKIRTLVWIWNIYYKNQCLGLGKSIFCWVRFYIETIKKYVLG